MTVFINIALWKYNPYSFERYTNMAANFFVVLIPRDGVKTHYFICRLHYMN